MSTGFTHTKRRFERPYLQRPQHIDVVITNSRQLPGLTSTHSLKPALHDAAWHRKRNACSIFARKDSSFCHPDFRSTNCEQRRKTVQWLKFWPANGLGLHPYTNMGDLRFFLGLGECYYVTICRSQPHIAHHMPFSSLYLATFYSCDLKTPPTPF